MRPAWAVVHGVIGRARYQLKLWRPEDHPRDPLTGRFIRNPLGPRRLRLAVPDNVDLVRRRQLTAGGLRKMKDDDLYALFVEITSIDHEDQLDKVALELVNAEIDRREAEPPDDSTPEERAVDDLVARGWSYVEAYADVHGEDAERLQREETAGIIDRRKGETRRQAIQRAYREQVYLQFVAAEEATNGYMVTKQGRVRGIDPITLFSGPSVRARKWASEELKRWWADNPRVTFTEFQASIERKPSQRRAAELARAAGQGRDFGV